MNAEVSLHRAGAADAPEVAAMAGELLAEIMQQTGVRAFNFDLAQTTARLADFLERGVYFVFLARDAGGTPLGFIALYESHALYAEGCFGTIAELYVRPGHRCGQLGRRLLASARALGVERGWTRLEVTTPPLPEFDRTLRFYEREGFAVTGGRKLKQALPPD